MTQIVTPERIEGSHDDTASAPKTEMMRAIVQQHVRRTPDGPRAPGHRQAGGQG